MRPAGRSCMKRSQSDERAAHVLGPLHVAVHDDREEPPCEVPRIGPAPSSSAFAFAASLPWVEVGSGLPPSAQTRRSIISFSGEEAWYQFTGVTIMTPCAATHIG